MESKAQKSKVRLEDYNQRAEWNTANERRIRKIYNIGRRESAREGAGHLAQGEEVQMVLLFHATVLRIPSPNNIHSLLGFPGRIHASLRANRTLVWLLHSFQLVFRGIMVSQSSSNAFALSSRLTSKVVECVSISVLLLMCICVTHLCIVPYREIFTAAAALTWPCSWPCQLYQTDRKQMEQKDGKQIPRLCFLPKV